MWRGLGRHRTLLWDTSPSSQRQSPSTDLGSQRQPPSADLGWERIEDVENWPSSFHQRQPFVADLGWERIDEVENLSVFPLSLMS